MSSILANGNSVSLSLSSAVKLGLSALAGTYSAIITVGEGKGTVLATDSAVDQAFGPYATGAVILLSSSIDGRIDFDVAVTPVLTNGESPTIIVSNTAPVNADGRPNGTIYIQTA
jgi:hypothetical protein